MSEKDKGKEPVQWDDRIQWQESQSERGRDTEYPWNH